MAIAGFNKDQIEIELSDGELSIKSKIKDQKLNESQNMIHKGISQRSFVRKFTYIVIMHTHHSRLVMIHEDYAKYDFPKQLEGSEKYKLAMDKRYRDPKMAHIQFLYYQYKPGSWWYEVLECVRKMVLTGLLLIVPSRLSGSQLALGLFICFIISIAIF